MSMHINTRTGGAATNSGSHFQTHEGQGGVQDQLSGIYERVQPDSLLQ